MSAKPFEKLKEETKEMAFVSSTRVGAMRYFRFRATARTPGYRVGDLIEFPVQCRVYR